MQPAECITKQCTLLVSMIYRDFESYYQHKSRRSASALMRVISSYKERGSHLEKVYY
jgi:hypothetical protein